MCLSKIIKKHILSFRKGEYSAVRYYILPFVQPKLNTQIAQICLLEISKSAIKWKYKRNNTNVSKM